MKKIGILRNKIPYGIYNAIIRIRHLLCGALKYPRLERLDMNIFLRRGTMIIDEDAECKVNKYFIKSVVDFLQLISDRTNELTKGYEYIFRGQANSEWTLMPSIAISSDVDNSLLKYESDMVNEFLKKRPDEFADIKNSIDILAKMQHYGLPTRLLDVTFNPLVALYFACKDDNVKDKDGEIFMFQKSKSIPFRLSFDVAARAAWGMLDFYGKFSKQISQEEFLSIAIDNSLIEGKDAKRYKDFYKNHIDLLLNTEPIVIIPIIYSERQYRQRAAFLLFQNEITKRNEGFENCFFIQCIKDFKDNVIHDMKMRIMIKKDNKDVIIEQLDKLGINEEFLFPEMEYAAKYIKRKYLSER